MKMSIKFRPLSNYVVLQVKVKDKHGSLHIPDSAEKPLLESIVVAVGESAQNVKIGDKVLFNVRHSGEVIDVWGSQYIILRENELFGILEDNPDYESSQKPIIHTLN